MAHLYAVATLAGILTVFFDVSYQAYLPSLVKRVELVEANSRLALTESIADVTGPGLTGLLVQLITAPTAILVDAASFLCSAVSVWTIRKPEPLPEPNPAPHIGREIAEGLRASWRNPVLRALLQRAAGGAFFGGFFGSLYFVFAVRDLHIAAVLLGIIISVGGASNLLGAIVAQRLLHRVGLGRTLIGATWMVGLAMLIVPLAHGPVLRCTAFLIAAQLGDMAWPIYNINETSLRQAITPEHLLGRVGSAGHLLFWGAPPVGRAGRRRDCRKHGNSPDDVAWRDGLSALRSGVHPLAHPPPAKTARIRRNRAVSRQRWGRRFRAANSAARAVA